MLPFCRGQELNGFLSGTSCGLQREENIEIGWTRNVRGENKSLRHKTHLITKAGVEEARGLKIRIKRHIRQQDK